MGGAAEETVQSKTGSGQTTVGQVRFHESGGEVHFHDDANGLKVAVPVSTWYKTWQELSNGLAKSAELVDPARKTMVAVTIKGGKRKPLDVSIAVSPVTISPNFEKFQKFANR
jgi:hypothetical protein